MMKMVIDGQKTSGRYRVECECGDSWEGEAPSYAPFMWSPALPVAECVAHLRLEHEHDTSDIRFTHRTEMWFMQYWEHLSLKMFEGSATAV